MTRFNIFLLAALAFSALGLVTAQHEARLTHIALERAQGETRRLDADWTHLRVQQTSLSAPALIESGARGQLSMDAPEPQRTLHAVRDPASGALSLRAVSVPTHGASAVRTQASTISPSPVGRPR